MTVFTVFHEVVPHEGIDPTAEPVTYYVSVHHTAKGGLLSDSFEASSDGKMTLNLYAEPDTEEEIFAVQNVPYSGKWTDTTPDEVIEQHEVLHPVINFFGKFNVPKAVRDFIREIVREGGLYMPGYPPSTPWFVPLHEIKRITWSEESPLELSPIPLKQGASE